MPDIENALTYALRQIGKPYSTGTDRFGPDAFDCSGLVIRSLAEANIPLPNGISAEHGWGNSVSLYNWGKAVGGLVSLDKAIQTRGAILIRGRWYGYGALGDVKFSLGNGQQTGAGSRRTGVATTTIRQGFFQDGFIIPGVNYHQKPLEEEDVITVQCENKPASADGLDQPYAQFVPHTTPGWTKGGAVLHRCSINHDIATSDKSKRIFVPDLRPGGSYWVSMMSKPSGKGVTFVDDKGQTSGVTAGNWS